MFGMIFEILFTFLAGFINFKNNTFNKNIINFVFPIIIYLIINLWQMNIYFIRDISRILTDLPIIIFLTLQIDYYIFLIITWIGVNYFMGLGGWGWLWGKSLTELRALKEKELSKAKPNEKLLKQIDEVISKKENESQD